LSLFQSLQSGCAWAFRAHKPTQIKVAIIRNRIMAMSPIDVVRYDGLR
ncbi:MAG: hypothetical protein GDA39_09785, partial [Hyphomonadaceae bacterium]|nr:hypothetical protein [Hyphomonadaceae bacterium]